MPAAAAVVVERAIFAKFYIRSTESHAVLRIRDVRFEGHRASQTTTVVEREGERLSEVDCLTKSKFAPIANVYKCVKCRARALGTLSAEEPKEPKQQQQQQQGQRQQLDEQSRVKRTSHSQPDAICMQMPPLATAATASGTTAGDVLPWRLANELVW